MLHTKFQTLLFTNSRVEFGINYINLFIQYLDELKPNISLGPMRLGREINERVCLPSTALYEQFCGECARDAFRTWRHIKDTLYKFRSK